MKQQLLIFGLAAVMLASCSKGDELAIENPSQTESSDGWKEAETLKADLISDIPIQFATIGGEADVSMTRASVSKTPFNVERLGVFCLSRSLQPGESHSFSWTGPSAIGELNDRLNVWEYNAKAHIEAYEGGSTGNVVWDDPDDYHYYPSKDWFTYNFVAYSPRSEYVTRNQKSMLVYIPVDGNDEVIYAAAEAPRSTSGNANNDALYYSAKYFRYYQENGGLNQEEHLPYFNFKRAMARLNFLFKFSEEYTLNDVRHEFHVDSVYIKDFPNLMVLEVAKLTGDVIAPNVGERPFVKDANAMPKTNGEFRWPDLTTYYGHFWLRDVDDSSIAEKNAQNKYKYIIGTDYAKVGDCILIPPVNKENVRSTVKLYINLRDEKGNVYSNITPIEIAAPDGGWLSAKQYDIKIVLKEPVYMDTRGVISDWEVPEVDKDVLDHYVWE